MNDESLTIVQVSDLFRSEHNMNVTGSFMFIFVLIAQNKLKVDKHGKDSLSEWRSWTIKESDLWAFFKDPEMIQKQPKTHLVPVENINIFPFKIEVSGSPMNCNHANEMPSVCSCSNNCYCKLNSCKPVFSTTG